MILRQFITLVCTITVLHLVASGVYYGKRGYENAVQHHDMACAAWHPGGTCLIADPKAHAEHGTTEFKDMCATFEETCNRWVALDVVGEAWSLWSFWLTGSKAASGGMMAMSYMTSLPVIGSVFLVSILVALASRILTSLETLDVSRILPSQSFEKVSWSKDAPSNPFHSLPVATPVFIPPKKMHPN